MPPFSYRRCAADDSVKYVDSVLEFPRPGIGSILFYMALEGVIFFLVTLLLEVRRFTPLHTFPICYQ